MDDPYNPRPVLPDLALLFALFIGFSWLEDVDGKGMPDLLQGFGGTAAVTLVAAVLCRFSADRTERVMAEDGAESAIVGSRAPMLYPLFAWLTANVAFRWDELVAALVPPNWFILPHVVFFLPLAVMTAAAWIAVDRSAAALTSSKPSARRALSAGLRRNALVLVPVAAVLLIHRSFLTLDSLGVPGVRRFLTAFHAYPDLVYLSLALGVAAAVVLAPGIVRRSLGAVPLPEGPVRTAVARLLEHLGVRTRDILLWPTEGRVQNALTVGAFARHRYIVLTDALVATYPLPELLAVVAHEAGHVRRRHLLLQGTALLSLVLIFLGSGALLAPWLPGVGETTLGLLVLWFGWFGLVGRLSRRFEREADVFAAEHAADLEPAAASTQPGSVQPAVAHTVIALKLAERAGTGFFRHGSPRVRMAYVMSWAASAPVREAEARSRGRTRAIIAGIALLAIAMTVARMPATLDRGHAMMAFNDAIDLSKAGDAARRRGNATSRDLDRRARELFHDVVGVAAARPTDRELAQLAAMAEYNAADRALRGFHDVATARAGFEQALKLAAKLDETESAPLRFAALIELGRISLTRTDDPAAAIRSAKNHLFEAQALPKSERTDRYHGERIRLLESSIALRSEVASEVERARRDLSVQAKGTGDTSSDWLELADDAKEELARVPAK